MGLRTTEVNRRFSLAVTRYSHTHTHWNSYVCWQHLAVYGRKLDWVCLLRLWLCLYKDCACVLLTINQILSFIPAFWESSLNKQLGTISAADSSLVQNRPPISLHGSCSDVLHTEDQTCTPFGKLLTKTCPDTSEVEKSCSSSALSFINPVFLKTQQDVTGNSEQWSQRTQQQKTENLVPLLHQDHLLLAFWFVALLHLQVRGLCLWVLALLERVGDTILHHDLHNLQTSTATAAPLR